MDAELLIARVISGTLRLRVHERSYIVRRADPEQVYESWEIYHQVLAEAKNEGNYDDDELLLFLLDNELWDEQRQLLLENLPKEIEEFKHKLFKATFKSNERKVVRKALGTARAKLAEVSQQRNAHNHFSCSGTASIVRTRFLVGASLWTGGGQKVFGAEDFWEQESGLLDDVLSAYAEASLDEKTIRFLSRHHFWQANWKLHKAEGSLFGIPAVCYSDEQRSLANWSVLYDNVYQHPDCPSDEVIGDDDLMDGWLIEQRRQREARMGLNEGEGAITNEKIRGSQEVFLPADTVADAKKIMEGMNDGYGRSIQKQRFEYLKKKGQVSELEMPDTAQRLRMETVQKLSAAMRTHQ